MYNPAGKVGTRSAWAMQLVVFGNLLLQAQSNFSSSLHMEHEGFPRTLIAA